MAGFGGVSGKFGRVTTNQPLQGTFPSLRPRESFVSTIVLDGLNEEDFRRSIENRLREGSAGAAIARLRALLAPYAGPSGILPERFLTVKAADLVLSGWDALGDAVCRHDKPGRPVTAISIAFGWPGDEVPAPDAEGHLRPHVETSYFSDNAFPFSQSGREDLLEGYSFYGCNWSGDSEATDTVLSLEGIDDLHGALARLEARLLASDEPDEEAIRAGSLGACLLSALLVQAVGERIGRGELPRPLCVMAGSSGVYPYFDAPVAGMPEDVRKAAEALEEEVAADLGAPVPRYSSLLMTGIPRAKKRAVLVLDESSDELANRIARLRGLNHAEGAEVPAGLEVEPNPPAPELPDPVVAAAIDSPLLAKKPGGQAWDFREMLSPREAEPPAEELPPSEPAEWGEPKLPPTPREVSGWDEPDLPLPPSDVSDWVEPDLPPPPREVSDWAEPALPPARNEPSVVPGFTLLDANLQMRLQHILSADARPIAYAPWSPLPESAEQSAEHGTEGPGWVDDSSMVAPQKLLPADPVVQPVKAGLRARFRSGVKALLARFGR